MKPKTFCLNYLSQLLVVDPTLRYTAYKALNHPWLQHGITKEATAETKDAVYKSIDVYSKEGEFKKLALQVIARKSTTAEIFKLRKVFDGMDTGGDGYITRKEFKTALTKTGSYSPEQIIVMFNDLDVNESGTIVYTEFLAATLEAHGRIEEQRVAEAFDNCC